MCPQCPRCHLSRMPCQDKFGSNMRPSGGCAGGMMALGGATEHQGNGTPHFHGEGHVVCAYQYGTLADIVEHLNRNDFTVEDVKNYHEWMHQEDIFDMEQYTAYRPQVELDWKDRFSGPQHDSMSQNPLYLDENRRGVSQRPAASSSTSLPADDPAAQGTDAEAWHKEYLQDVQFIFSRVQHHVHKRSPTKGYVPINACKCKGKTQKLVCKANFPRPECQCLSTSLVICGGLAKKLGLKTTGRRNALGSTLGKRRCQWQSGTHPAFAVLFRSNTHTAPNFRVPIMPGTHEDSVCHSKCCRRILEGPDAARQLKVQSKIAQRAQRQATGYYCGYTFKGQPVGKKFLRAASETLNYLKTSLESKTTEGQRWHRLTHTMFTDFQHRSMLRTAAEEQNLCNFMSY